MRHLFYMCKSFIVSYDLPLCFATEEELSFYVSLMGIRKCSLFVAKTTKVPLLLRFHLKKFRFRCNGNIKVPLLLHHGSLSIANMPIKCSTFVANMFLSYCAIVPLLLHLFFIVNYISDSYNTLII